MLHRPPKDHSDIHNLQRFVDAQEPVIEDVLEELRDGRKRTHWMWFVFPQLAALGQSPTAKHFGIASLDEARAYIEHPALGPRLRQCTAMATEAPGSAEDIFGYPDDLKFHSCVTLFAQATPDNSEFLAALVRQARRWLSTTPIRLPGGCRPQYARARSAHGR